LIRKQGPSGVAVTGASKQYVAVSLLTRHPLLTHTIIYLLTHCQ